MVYVFFSLAGNLNDPEKEMQVIQYEGFSSNVNIFPMGVEFWKTQP